MSDPEEVNEVTEEDSAELDESDLESVAGGAHFHGNMPGL